MSNVLSGFKEMTNKEHTECILNVIRSQEKKRKIQRYTTTVCGQTGNIISLTFEY